MPKAKGAPPPDDPDRLVRQAAGRYRSADDRFEVRDAGTGWFLVDMQRTNDFGQELMQGPFATLAAVREAIPSARSAKVTPIRAPARARRSRQSDPPASPPAPPPSWIDRLPAGEAAQVRRLIATLEQHGLADAESVVQRDHEAGVPAVASALIQQRLETIVAELPEAARPGARDLFRRVAEVLTVDGLARPDGLPGWMLIELDAEPEPRNRRITVRDLPGR